MNFFNLLKIMFNRNKDTEHNMKKYLIIGLGNVGSNYINTRHNIGFNILDAIALKNDAIFEIQKLGSIAKFKFKGRLFILLKPSTLMNLSGKAVKYWMVKEKIPLNNLLVICDDLNIPFGMIRLKGKGSSGGHNGLNDINSHLNSKNYARLRFGIGSEFNNGRQTDYVLGNWNALETEKLKERLEKTSELIISFGTSGLADTMSNFNGK
jgi:PTH1 family peptidyl-tRNA hydrolase